MSADLGLDGHVDELTRSERIVEWVRNFIRLAEEFSRRNIFGNVAEADVGTADGNAPVLDGNARLPESLTPAVPAAKITSGEFGAGDIPDLPASRASSGEFDAARFSFPVTKLEGMVPAARTPASVRAALRVGVASVSVGPSIGRVMRDAAKAREWGSAPEISVVMDNGEAGGTDFREGEYRFTLVTTYYVARDREAFDADFGDMGSDRDVGGRVMRSRPAQDEAVFSLMGDLRAVDEAFAMEAAHAAASRAKDDSDARAAGRDPGSGSTGGGGGFFGADPDAPAGPK